jgi:hypothetical protein
MVCLLKIYRDNNNNNNINNNNDTTTPTTNNNNIIIIINNLRFILCTHFRFSDTQQIYGHFLSVRLHDGH